MMLCVAGQHLPWMDSLTHIFRENSPLPDLILRWFSFGGSNPIASSMNRWSNFITTTLMVIFHVKPIVCQFVDQSFTAKTLGVLNLAVMQGVGVGRTAPGGFHDGSAAAGLYGMKGSRKTGDESRHLGY